MVLKSDSVLKILGYKVDNKGNIRESDAQMALISLEQTDDGGILRVHGNSDSFFYKSDEYVENLRLYYPKKISSRYVYFSDSSTEFKIKKSEFDESLMLALREYQNTASKESLRG